MYQHIFKKICLTKSHYIKNMRFRNNTKITSVTNDKLQFLN